MEEQVIRKAVRENKYFYVYILARKVHRVDPLPAEKVSQFYGNYIHLFVKNF